MGSRGYGDNNSEVILLVRYYASFDVLRYVAYLFVQESPSQSLFINFIVDVVIADNPAGLPSAIKNC